jgi:hypothetical protein
MARDKTLRLVSGFSPRIRTQVKVAKINIYGPTRRLDFVIVYDLKMRLLYSGRVLIFLCSLT